MGTIFFTVPSLSAAPLILYAVKYYEGTGVIAVLAADYK